VFEISQVNNTKNQKCLEKMQSFLSKNSQENDFIGRFYLNKYSERNKQHQDLLQYACSDLPSLCLYLIPHFNKYKLLTSKKKDFEIFCGICTIRQEKDLQDEDICFIIEKAYEMNPSHPRRNNWVLDHLKKLKGSL